MRNFRKYLLFLVIITLLVGAVFLSLKFMRARDYKRYYSHVEIEQFTLSNGMEVLILPNHKTHGVSHMVWYKVGGMDEVNGKTGLAHFLEHLLFHGTKKFPKDYMDKRVADLGGSHNAFTSYDYTAYYQDVPRGALAEVMKMESDRMRNIILKEKEALNERKIVLEERLMRRDNSPKAVVREKIREAMFGKNHPYGRPLIGYEDDIEKLSFKDAKDFYNKYYYPNNAVLVIAGDVTKKDVLEDINKYYGVIPEGPEKLFNKVEYLEEVERGNVEHKDSNVSNFSVYYSYLAPDLNSPEPKYCYALSIISHLLAGGKKSILHKRLVVEEDLVIGVDSSYSDFGKGQTSFDISVTLKDKKNERKVKEIINQEITKLEKGKVSKKELENSKKLFLIETIYNKESYKSLAYIFGMGYTSGISVEEIMSWEEKVAAVKISDIKDAAAYVFQDKKLVTGYLMPKK